jgi:hypothetical protein
MHDVFRPRFPRWPICSTKRKPITCMPVLPLDKVLGNHPHASRYEEVKRHTVDIGIFPKTAVLLRLVRMLLAEQDEDTGVANQNQAVGKPPITR